MFKQIVVEQIKPIDNINSLFLSLRSLCLPVKRIGFEMNIGSKYVIR